VGCLDLDTLTSLFESTIRDRSAIESHIDGCVACRELVAAYARAADDASDAVTLAHTPYARTMSSAVPAPANDQLQPGSLVGGRYLLEHVVGEGGMGIVWAAKDLYSDRAVALKMLKDASPELARRSWREARAAAHVAHPALLEVLDVVAQGNDIAPILVMPLLMGKSLDRAIAERGKLSVLETLAVLTPVVSGMRAAHARGIIHRDLKPPNVFLADAPLDSGIAGAASTVRPHEPVVLVLDFGLAKMLSPDGSDAGADKLTRTGAVLGTPHYMAPEQLYGDASVDQRADVWAIGAIAYEMLSGKRPIEGKSYGQIVRNAARGAIPKLGEIAPSVPPPLAALVMAMLSSDRESRPDLSFVHAILLGLREQMAR
jgi:serine/threonine-protein kinase